MTKKPKLGQHFLADDDLLERIAAAVPQDCDLIVEIGPGKGALTRRLLARPRRVAAIELDAALAAALPGLCGCSERLEIICGDVLRVDLPRLIRARTTQRAAVVGNLPYAVTSPILRKVWEAQGFCGQCVFLVQEEVADRIVAGPGSRDYGYLSCLAQLRGVPRKLFVVPPGAFRPPPKVSSAVISMSLHAQPPADGLLDFLGDCFRAPRKMLRNNLAARFPAAKAASDPCANLRAQQLSLEELTAMWRRLSGRRE